MHGVDLQVLLYIRTIKTSIILALRCSIGATLIATCQIQEMHLHVLSEVDLTDVVYTDMRCLSCVQASVVVHL